MAHGHLPADFVAVAEVELWSPVYLALSLFPATQTGQGWHLEDGKMQGSSRKASPRETWH